MNKAVDNFLNNGFAFNELRLAVNLILYVFEIPVDKLTASDSTVFICAAKRGNVLCQLKLCLQNTKLSHTVNPRIEAPGFYQYNLP